MLKPPWSSGQQTMMPPTDADQQVASVRRAAFIDAIPTELVQLEATIPTRITSLNAAPRAKLRHIYRLVDDLSTIRAPFVACRKGCSYCCHMNVTITKDEAAQISRAAGRRVAQLVASIQHEPTKFAGHACPFLSQDGLCSVYEHRPLACRLHASFFEDSAACHPSIMNKVNVPKVEFSGPEEAVKATSGGAELIVADIRDFFPSKGNSA